MGDKNPKNKGAKAPKRKERGANAPEPVAKPA